MSDIHPAPNIGATAGLPGANAAPATREPGRDELDVVEAGDLRTTPTDPVADRDADDLVDEQAGRETLDDVRRFEAEDALGDSGDVGGSGERADRTVEPEGVGDGGGAAGQRRREAEGG